VVVYKSLPRLTIRQKTRPAPCGRKTSLGDQSPDVNRTEAGLNCDRNRFSWARGICRAPTRLARVGLDLLLPPACTLCGNGLDSSSDRLALCAACRGLLAPELWVGCRHCGTGLPEAAERCGWCQRFDLHFDAVVPLGHYQGELRDAVLRTKHASGQTLLVALAALWIQRRGMMLHPIEPQAIVPIPMHWQRQMWTGMNNADRIARFLSRRLRVPLLRCLMCSRKILQQKNLRLKDRFRNVCDAFVVRKGYDLRGARVLLVEDVLTTGATCSSAAKVLKQAGANQVVAAVLARADEATA